MYSIKKISNFEDFDSDRWNSLVSANELNSVFLRYEWMKTWFKHCGYGSLLILLIKKQDYVVGIAPLMINESGIVKFIGNPSSDYCDFIIIEDKKEVLYTIFEYLHSIKSEWKGISLEEIPENSSSIKIAKKALNDLGFYSDISFSNKCLAMSFAGVDKSAFSKKDVNRNMNYFKREGSLLFENVTDTSESVELLDKLMDQHIKIWNARGRVSIFSDNCYKNFLIDITKKMPLIVNLLTLKFNDKPISFHYGFNYNSKFIAYCQSYDLEFSRKGPSTILNKLMLDHFFDLGLSEVDFSRGAESYKERFTNKISTNYNIAVSKNLFSYLSVKIYNKIKKEVMKHEKLHNFINKYKMRFLHKKQNDKNL